MAVDLGSRHCRRMSPRPILLDRITHASEALTALFDAIYRNPDDDDDQSRLDTAEQVRSEACNSLTAAVADGCWDAWVTVDAITALEGLSSVERQHKYGHKGSEIIAACLDRAAADMRDNLTVAAMGRSGAPEKMIEALRNDARNIHRSEDEE